MPRSPAAEAFRQRIAERMNPSPDRNVDDEMWKFRKSLEAHIEERQAAMASGAAEAEFRFFRRRIVAELVDLAPSCKLGRCRRAGVCRGPKTPCIEDRQELVAERLRVLLGYRAGISPPGNGRALRKGEKECRG